MYVYIMSKATAKNLLPPSYDPSPPSAVELEGQH